MNRFGEQATATEQVFAILSSLCLACYPEQEVLNGDWAKWLDAFRAPEFCPECGRALLAKSGKYGGFVGCSGWPGCKYTKVKDKRGEK